MNDKEIIISGVHLDLTDSLKNIVHEKAEKLYNHDTRIIRLRVELEYNLNKRGGKQQEYIAKGHLETSGPPMVVTVESDNLYKSIDQMVDKLNRMVRRKHRLYRVKRKNKHSVDIPAELPKVEIA